MVKWESREDFIVLTMPLIKSYFCHENISRRKCNLISRWISKYRPCRLLVASLMSASPCWYCCSRADIRTTDSVRISVSYQLLWPHQPPSRDYIWYPHMLKLCSAETWYRACRTSDSASGAAVAVSCQLIPCLVYHWSITGTWEQRETCQT